MKTEMLHEHPLELADIKAGMGERLPEPAVLRKRRMIYYPIAAVVGLGLLFAVYGFVNGEQTAITTVPPQVATVVVYVPQTPTPLPPTADARSFSNCRANQRCSNDGPRPAAPRL